MKVPHPEQLLFESTENALDAAVALGLTHEGGRGFDAEEASFLLKMVAHELGAVIVAQLQAGGDVLGEAAEILFDLASDAFIDRREDALFLGPGGAGRSHLAQAIGQAAILQGYKVLYRETHILLEELADATLDGTRKQYMESISSVALLIIDDFGMRKLPQTAAEDLLEIMMRR